MWGTNFFAQISLIYKHKSIEAEMNIGKSNFSNKLRLPNKDANMWSA